MKRISPDDFYNPDFYNDQKCIVFTDENPIGLESQINEWIHNTNYVIEHISHSWAFQNTKSRVSALIIYR